MELVKSNIDKCDFEWLARRSMRLLAGFRLAYSTGGTTASKWLIAWLMHTKTIFNPSLFKQDTIDVYCYIVVGSKCGYRLPDLSTNFVRKTVLIQEQCISKGVVRMLGAFVEDQRCTRTLILHVTTY